MAEGDKSLQPIVANVARLALPVIVLGEFQFGIIGSRKRSHYEQWLQEILESCRVLIVDEGTAVEYASIRDQLKANGRPIPSNDAWIAALARQHSLPIASRDAHFDFVPNVRRVIW
jgi:predicted nucleic acid-binding protein